MNKTIMTPDGVKKQCSSCKEFFLLDEMCKRGGGKPGAECKNCANARHQKWVKKNAELFKKNPNDKRHGTRYGYTLGCKCGLCTEAELIYQKDYQQRRKKNANQD